MSQPHATAVQHCPKCGTLLECCTGVLHDSAPTEGDLSVCACCAVMLRFDATLTVRELGDAEFWTLHPDERRELTQAQGIILYRITHK